MTAPVNSVAPAIIGTAAVGVTLTLGNGTWINTPTSYAYAWLLAGVAIAGATASTYTVLRAQIGIAISGQVTATNVDGSAAAVSSSQTIPGTLIPETGAALSMADSYISLADANTYHDELGNAEWSALSDADKESALRRATKYITIMYRERWAGYRVNSTQALDWPRYLVPKTDFVYGGGYNYYPGDSVPREVVQANAEMALRAAAGELIEDTEPPVIEETVGPITTRYAQGASREKRFPSVDRLLAPLLSGQGGVKLVRA